MPLIKRSYEKQSEMLDGKNFVCRKLYGENIDKNPYCYGYDKEKASRGLSQEGKKLIGLFINENLKREKMLRQREEMVYNDIHSKYTPKNARPLWKSGLSIMEHFGPPLIDKVRKFRAPEIEKHQINQPPFRRPKEQGEYFDPNIHMLGAPEI